MKDQDESQAKRKRVLVGRNEFPPFKRNQLRWALHCYRWKEGISWEKYPYVIASALGMKELGEGLNSRDPRGFVLEGQTPTPEKLRLYERFIQKAAPTYAKALTEDDLLQTCANVVARYTSGEELSFQGEPARTASALEQRVYFSPFPGITGFNHMTSLGTHMIVLGLRRIGETPYLQLFIFGLMVSDVIRNAREEHDAESGEITKRQDANDMTLELQETIYKRVMGLPFDDNLSFTTFFSGVAVPHTNGNHFIAILKSKAYEPCFLQFSLCRFQKSGTELVWHLRHHVSFKDTDLDDPYLAVCMILNQVTSGEGLRPDTDYCVMHGEAHEMAQAFFSRMRA